MLELVSRKTGVSGVVESGKKAKERKAVRPTVLQLSREAPEGLGIGDYYSLMQLSCKNNSFLSLYQMIFAWNQLSTEKKEVCIFNYRTCRF